MKWLVLGWMTMQISHLTTSVGPI